MSGHTFSVTVSPLAPVEGVVAAPMSQHERQPDWLNVVDAARYLRLPCLR
jgi:hypothetical protein